ncbi:DUF367 family protein [Fervidicoccus sp.]|uniref:DUF367 family protein n=1 Tax=Fervidicoccus sp. TaxID=2060324 RepID=UPI003D0ACB60
MQNYCSNLKIYVYRISEDYYKASTAVKLYKLKVATRVGDPRKLRKKFIVLDPFSQKVISKDDISYNLNGILVVDRSWNKILEKGGEVFPFKFGVRRRLPIFIASNPINYGIAYKLSSAEALAAALIILGCIERAKEILSYFKWGENFFSLNSKLIIDYVKASNEKDVLEIEEEFIKDIQGR